MRTSRILPLLPLTCAAFASTSLPAAVLHVLEPHSLDSFNYGLGVSADGTAVGYSDNFDTVTPTLWTKSAAGYGAASGLPLLSGGSGGVARWISSDASLIAGRVSVSTASDDAADYAPIVWARTGAGAYAVAALPRLGSTPAEAAVTAGTATGSRFVGHDGPSLSAAVWRRSGSGYSVQALPLPSSANGPSFATAISADGTRIAGRYLVDDLSQALVWSESGGAYTHRALQTLAGGIESFAETISADGTLAAGSSDSANGVVPVKWDTATGVVTALEVLPGDYGTVNAISDDKQWLGGSSTDSNTFDGSAVLWNQSGQLQDLVDLAADAGVSFQNLDPQSVTGVHLVSSGVYTIVGTGVSLDTGYTQGFVLENLVLGAAPIPEPSTSVLVVSSASLAGAYMTRRRPGPAVATSVETTGPSRTLGSSSVRPRAPHATSQDTASK